MEQGRMVKVRGLPTDVGDDRLKDKLLIHFLRSRNGGGEIQHLSFDKKEPGSALITFEDRAVAQRVAQRHWHVLDVDGRTFELSVSEYCGGLDPDQVILNVSATVDFTVIPGGKGVLTSLHQRHPDVQTIYDHSTMTCIVCGSYSKVHLVLAHLLSISQDSSSSSGKKPESPKTQEHTFKEHREKKAREHKSRHSEARDTKAHTDQRAAGELSKLVEDFSLIVDSDMFQYLQLRCQEQYHQILCQYGVEVVDVTNQGLTTLFLRIADPDHGDEKERIQMAQDAISKLYQENEIKIRKDHLSKSILTFKAGLQGTLKNIREKYPGIILTEDDTNIYIIGNRSDVCDAKQILLLDPGEEPFFPDVKGTLHNQSISAVNTDSLKLSTPTAASLSDKKGHQPGEEERRSDTKYKLASRFKDSGLSTLGNLPGEFSFSSRTPTSNSLKSRKPVPVTQVEDCRPVMKRTSSFSGAPHRKTEVKAPAIKDDLMLTASKSKAPTGCSLRGEWDVYHEELVAPSVLWEYIKEAYGSEVDDITSDVQVKESSSVNGDVSLNIRGAIHPKVFVCLSSLQNLIDSIRPDFSRVEIRLPELGISDPANETLLACCEEVRRRFAKVMVRILKDSLLLTGPKKLCTQVAASLQEVFRGRSTKAEDLVSSGFSSSRVATDETDSTANSRLKSPGASAQPHFSPGSSVRKEPVSKEKVTSLGTSEQRIFIQGTSTGYEFNREKSPRKSERTLQHLDDGGRKLQDSPSSASKLVQGDHLICVCGRTDSPMSRTECGTTMCFNCLEAVHVSCRVCRSPEKTQRGVQGKMSHSRLNVSIPGSKDSAVKVTYFIPNGIQGDSHPSPGQPFRGATFEAFLPDCSKTRKLLPRLEEAFRLGLTFTVTNQDAGAKVTWASIPHKTSLQGGKSGKGYPDSNYLSHLSSVLTSLGIPE